VTTNGRHLPGGGQRFSPAAWPGHHGFHVGLSGITGTTSRCRASRVPRR